MVTKNNLLVFSIVSHFFLAKSVRLLDSLPWDSKRKKLNLEEPFEDIPEKLIAEIFKTIDDPNYMTGPDVSSIGLHISIIIICFVIFLNSLKLKQ